MHTTASHRRIRPLHAPLLAVVCTLLVACGNGLSGVYVSAQGMQMEFHSNGKVEMGAMGMAQEGTYAVEDGKAKISVAGQTMIMKIDDKGCLEGGFALGKLCKE
jgi:hypothetical protein